MSENYLRAEDFVSEFLKGNKPHWKLLSPGTANYKTNKSKGVLTTILHLTPHKQSGLGNLCPMAERDNYREAKAEIARGTSIAIVCAGVKRDSPFPYNILSGYTVVDADVDDKRYEDPPSSLSLLRTKGDARTRQSVVTTSQLIAGFGGKQTNATPCHKFCLVTSGRGAYSSVQVARLAKTILYQKHRQTFLAKIDKELQALVKKGERLGLDVSARLNGTSDIQWERVAPELFDLPITYYDYTKVAGRTTPDNYHLTYSLNKIHHIDDLPQIASLLSA